MVLQVASQQEVRFRAGLLFLFLRCASLGFLFGRQRLAHVTVLLLPHFFGNLLLRVHHRVLVLTALSIRVLLTNLLARFEASHVLFVSKRLTGLLILSWRLATVGVIELLLWRKANTSRFETVIVVVLLLLDPLFLRVQGLNLRLLLNAILHLVGNWLPFAPQLHSRRRSTRIAILVLWRVVSLPFGCVLAFSHVLKFLAIRTNHLTAFLVLMLLRVILSFVALLVHSVLARRLCKRRLVGASVTREPAHIGRVLMVNGFCRHR